MKIASFVPISIYFCKFVTLISIFSTGEYYGPNCLEKIKNTLLFILVYQNYRSSGSSGPRADRVSTIIRGDEYQDHVASDEAWTNPVI